MTRTTLLLVVLLAATALLVPTGAVGVSSPSGVDPAPQLQGIEMAPADGPNGAYAVLDENGRIAILLSDENPGIEAGGINVDAEVTLENVFTISYTGEGSADVWLTDDVDDVRFFRGEDAGDSIEGRENNVTLEPGEPLHVGLRVDTSGDYQDVENMDGFSVHANLPDRDGGNSNAVVAGSSDEASAATATNPTSTPTPTATPTATITPTESAPEDTPTQTTTSPPEADSGSETTRTRTITATRATSTEGGQQNAQLLGGFGLPAPLALLAAALLTVLLLALWRRRTGGEQE